jgi:hypothetical protein
LLALVVAGCSSDVALGGPNTLVRVDPEPAGPNCPDGGLAINTGLDRNGNGYLDDDEILSTQYVCNGGQPIQCAGGRIVEGTVSIETTADWAKIQDAECVDGDLLIAGVPDDAIPPQSLAIVTGGVVIVGNQNMTSLDGLSQLRLVGGTYLVQGNPAMTSITALQALKIALKVSIVGNDALTNLSGLDQMTNITMDLVISNNNGLTSLAGLDNLTTTNRTLTVHSNHNLTDLSALNKLRSIQLIEISGNDSLTGINIPELSQVGGRVLINNNAALQTVTLPALTTVGDFIQLDSNGAVQSFNTPELLTVGSILADNDTSLTTLAAPKLLFATNLITLFTLPKLFSIDLKKVASVGGTLRIDTVPTLANFTGFAGLGSIGGGFTVANNSGIHDFTGLGNLQLVSGDMLVQSNATLSSFNGLGALNEVGGALTIILNPMLAPATSQAFASHLTVHGKVTIN